MLKKIRNSILLQLICIILVTLAVLTGTFLGSQSYVRQLSLRNAEMLADSILKQTDNALSIYEDNLRYNAAYLCRFSVVEKLGSGIYEANVVDEAQLSSYFSQIAQNNREIVSAILYNTEMEEVTSFGRELTLPARQNYLRTEEELNADYYFGENGDFYYAFYYPIYNVIDGQGSQAGMCVFILEHWALDGTARNLLGSYSAAMLLSDSNHLDLSYHTAGVLPDHARMQDLKERDDMVYREGDWQNGIRIAVAVSASRNEEGSEVVKQLLTVAYTLAILLLGIIIFFSWHRMAHPLHQVTRFINRAIGNPSERLQMKRTDDIGVVASSLDRMLDENQKMIQEIKESKIRLYETQLARQEMEILAYRNQINPHFLYNTLSCMRDMALIHDEDDIAEMALSLSDIFRYAVKGSNIVSVRDEIEYIEKYAKIIDYRFMGKITIDVRAEEEAYEIPVIRFFLQPLVENAVFHGLESSLDPGTVTVSLALTGDRLEISVRDDGCGMNEETLQKVREQILNPGESASIGLSNIVQRLRLFYGEDFSLTADSTEGRGTEIRISLPDHMKNGES